MVSIDRLQYELQIATEETIILSNLLESIPLNQAHHNQNRHGTRIIQAALKNAYNVISEIKKE
jgi:hypothetical protein